MPGYLPCPLGWPCFYCPLAVHGVSWGSGPRWAPAGGREEGVACPGWLPAHPGLAVLLSPGQRCSCMWYWEHWSHWARRSDTGHRLPCVLQPGMSDLFQPQHHPLSSAGCSPRPLTAQTQFAAGAAAEEASGKPRITFSAGERCSQTPPASGGGGRAGFGTIKAPAASYLSEQLLLMGL